LLSLIIVRKSRVIHPPTFLLSISIISLFVFLLPRAKGQNSQTVVNGSATTAVNFPGTGCVYTWVNNNPSIGFPSSGTGNIPSFTAVNISSSPITATITATPISSEFVYIANALSNTVSVLSTATNTALATIPVEKYPWGVFVSPDGSSVYVTNANSNSISVISTKTNTVVATIPVGNFPTGLSVSPDGSRLYVANEGSNNVSVINTLTNSVISTVAVGLGPLDISITPDGNYAYVTNGQSSTVSVINITTATVAATIPVGFEPLNALVSADGKLVYISSDGTKYISIISTATNTVIGSILIGSYSEGLVLSPDGKLLYTTNATTNNVYVISTATNMVISTISVGLSGFGPEGISLTADGSLLYAATRGDFIAVINTKTNSVLSNVTVGSYPVSFGSFITKGTGCNGIPVTFTITVNPAVTATATITSGTVTGNISACAGSASASPSIQQFTVSGSNLSGDIKATAPTGFEASLNANSGFGTTVTLIQSTGMLSNSVIYVRSAAAAQAGSISGNLVLSSTGAAVKNVAVTGTINALPVVNIVSNQTYSNGTVTTGVRFSGTANALTWNNDTPGIGLSTSGSGDIKPFTAVNNSNSPVTATITVTPLSPGLEYVVNQNSNSVSVININTNAVIATVPVGVQPYGVALSSDGTIAYVTNLGSGTVSVINSISLTVVANITVGPNPHGITISPDGSRVYVANAGDNSVSVISTASNTVIANIPAGVGPQCIAISPDGSLIYVPSYLSNNVVVISTATNAIVNTIAVGINPVSIIESPDGSRLYVVNYNSNNVSVINTATNQVTATIPVIDRSDNICISPDGSYVYVTNQFLNAVHVINTATNQVTGVINVGPNPSGVSCAPDGRQLYVSNADGTVSVVSTATNKVVSIINVGAGPIISANSISAGTGCLGTPVIFTITVNPAVASISSTGTSSPVNTTYGTPSMPESFTVSGTNMTDAILITPPPGFELSVDNVIFRNTVIVGAPGAITPTMVYIRLKSTTPVGNYSGNIVLSGAGATNFNVAMPNSTVDPALLTITMSNIQKIYGMALINSSSSTGFTVMGLQNSETIGSVIITYSTGAAANSAIGTYSGSVNASSTIGGSFAASNYQITYIHGDIMVYPAALTIAADNKTRIYHAVNPVLTASYTGFVNMEGPDQLTAQPQITTTATISSPAGDYPIIISGAASANYTFTFIPGILTIIPVSQSIIIPTAFTPNGDGINDVWNIPSLPIFSQCTVTVYSRYGNLIYQSKGYSKPWDGTANGNAVPVGTYYYVINLQNGTNELTGPVTIVR
jgi:gliding motility-associated-like protein